MKNSHYNGKQFDCETFITSIKTLQKEKHTILMIFNIKVTDYILPED